MRGRATGVVLPALAVLALVAVVAIAATGSTPRGTSASRRPSDSFLDALFTIYLLAIVAGGVLLVYGLSQRQAIRREIASGRYRRATLSTWVLLILVFAIVTYFRAKHWKPQPQEQGGGDQAFPGQPPGQGTPRSRTLLPYEPGVSWISVALVLLLVAAAAVAFVVSERRHRLSRPPSDRGLAEQLALTLDEALDDLRAEADPRRAIVAAYARMERVLAAYGLPRRTAETPDEYLARVLHELVPDSDAVARLTRLFAEAKFSHHEVDADMKDQAIEALEQVRDELRRDRRPVDREMLPAEAAS